MTGVTRGDGTEGGEEGKGERDEILAHGRSDGPKNNNMEIVPHNNHNTRPKQMTLNKLFILTYAPTIWSIKKTFLTPKKDVSIKYKGSHSV